MATITDQDMIATGHERVADNLWRKGESHYYLRKGEITPAHGITPEDARYYGVDTRMLPKTDVPKPKEPTGLEKYAGKTATLNELRGPDYHEAREIAEALDARLMEAEIAGEVVDKFVYSFPNSGRTVQGLTWPGVRFIAKHVGKIEIETIDVIDGPDAWVIKCRARDLKSGVAMFGMVEQSKTLTRKDGKVERDHFGLEKACSRAQRNAMRALIPEQESIMLLGKWLAEAKNGKKP